MTVASAAPATPISKTKINKGSSNTFTIAPERMPHKAKRALP